MTTAVAAPPLFDQEKMAAFPTGDFADRAPFPWYNFHEILTPEAFQRLYDEYPALEKFERHQGIQRNYGQRPHDRYYMAYEQTIYKGLDREDGEGVIRREELSPAWQQFMDELETSPTYREFICRLLGVPDFRARYAWHVGVTNSEVSPHRDADAKIATHIFYFNTHEDWDEAWGGSTLVLAGKEVPAMNPDFSDFTSEIAGKIVDNHSFLFKNTENAWHGVRKLTCPPGKYRRLFNVIFEVPRPEKKGLLGKLGGLVGLGRK
jgi:hypothetical protein